MIKTTRKIIVLFLLLALLTGIVGCESQEDETNISLSSERIQEHLNALISDEFEGRMTGTEGNVKTVEYIKDHFSEIGLLPANGGSFLNTFNTNVPSLKTAIIFNVFDEEGNLVKEFVQGKDFVSRFDSYNMGGSFSGSAFVIVKDEELKSASLMFHELAVLVDVTDSAISPRHAVAMEILNAKGAEVIIYKEKGPMDVRLIDIGRKKNFIPSSGPIMLGVNPQAYNLLVDFFAAGYTIEVESSLTFREIETHNILGVIPGTSSQRENYIMIATSFDGLGIDEHGKIHRSVTNNATAVATMLEIAETMKENNLTFDSTIVFAAFNGRHIGLAGISDYIQNTIFPSERMQVIFLENIASNENAPLLIGTFERAESNRKRSKLLVNRLSEIAEKEEIEHRVDFKYFISEYFPFRRAGTIASVLTHGSDDEIADIDIEEAALIASKVGDISVAYILKHADVSLLTDVLKPFIYMMPLILLLILVVIAKFYRRPIFKNMITNSINKVLNYPIVSIMSLLILIGLIFVMQLRHNVADTTGALFSDIEISFSLFFPYLLASLPALIVMMSQFAFFIFIILFVTFISILLFSKKSNITFAVITMVTTYLSYFSMMKNVFHCGFIVTLPNLMSFTSIGIVSHAIVCLITLGITLIWMAEKERVERYEMTHVKIAICYIVVFLIITFILVGPLLYETSLFQQMITGRRIRF